MSDEYIEGLRGIEAFIMERVQETSNPVFGQGIYSEAHRLLSPLWAYRPGSHYVDDGKRSFNDKNYTDNPVDNSWSIARDDLGRIVDLYAAQLKHDLEVVKGFTRHVTYSPNASAILFGGLYAFADRKTSPQEEGAIKQSIEAEFGRQADGFAWYAVATAIRPSGSLGSHSVFGIHEAARMKAG